MKFRAKIKIGFYETTTIVEADSEEVAESALKNSYARRMSKEENDVKVILMPVGTRKPRGGNYAY